MKVLIITTALVAALISNSVSAKSQIKITCKTGFFSSDTFFIIEDDLIEIDRGFDIHMFSDGPDRAVKLVKKTHLLSDGFTNLDTHINTKDWPDGFRWADILPSFTWEAGERSYSLWELGSGWRYRIKEKDWSSSEGNHWDEVLKKTYCK